MSTSLGRDQISELSRIDDRAAGALVSIEALLELKEAILEIPPAPVRGARSVSRRSE